MPGDDDPYQAQWNLRPRIEAIRAEAKSVREQNLEHYKTKESELAITRDRLAREQYGVEQQAKSADIQVGVENKEVQRISDGLVKREAEMADAEKRGDTAKAQEDREDIAAWRAEQATHEARARQATLDAAELREQAAGIDRQRTELMVERDNVAGQGGKIETEIDKMEQQADTLQQARLKYAEADLSNDVAKRSALELEAQALVTKANAIEVDRSLIRTVVPELPDTTPGIDADPGPLPPGSGDDSSTVPTNDTDLMDPNDVEGDGEREPNDTDLMDPNDLSLTIPGSADGNEQPAGDGEVARAAAANYVANDPAEFEPINDYSSASGSDALADSSSYETPAYETPGYEAPAFEEPAYSDPVAAADESYGGPTDFSAPADTDAGYSEPSYEETFDG